MLCRPRVSTIGSRNVRDLDALITNVSAQYNQLSREYSEIADEERKENIADTMSSVDYQLARLEEQGQALANHRTRAAGVG